MLNTHICTIINQRNLKIFITVFSLVSVIGCSGPVYKPASRSSYQDRHLVKTGPAKKSIIHKARALIGKPYRYGGNHPATGFDCSGFVQYTHATAGIELPRTTYQQLRATHPITRQQLRPGDLVFFRINKKRFVSHVGIYLGDSKFIHAPSSGKKVSIASLDNPYWRRVYSSARRVF